MGIYDRYVLPHVIHLACGNKDVGRQREKVVPLATGRVLEVGMGSGLNLPYYDGEQVELVWGLEPSEGMRKKAQKNLAAAEIEVRWLDLPGEEIPLEDDTVDTVVLTYTLCTIPGWKQALEQMRRVLKPGGKMVFSEHGQAPDAAVRKWQDRIDPWWGRISGGCHLNRPIPQMLEQGGFALQEVDSLYLPGPKWATFNTWGVVTAR